MNGRSESSESFLAKSKPILNKSSTPIIGYGLEDIALEFKEKSTENGNGQGWRKEPNAADREILKLHYFNAFHF